MKETDDSTAEVNTRMEKTPSKQGVETAEYTLQDAQEQQPKVEVDKTQKSDNSPEEIEETIAVEKMLIGGIECKTIGDEHFARIRRQYGVKNSFASTKDDVSFENLAKAGGKGGDPMTRSSDNKFFVKQLNKGDSTVLESVAKDLADYLTSNESLLAPIFVHFEMDRKRYMAMLNCLPYKGQYSKLYDLKGCADDKLLVNDGEKIPEVHKRIWKPKLWCGCGGEARKKYFNGKLEALHAPTIPLLASQREAVLKTIKNDCEWLKLRNLMDYSLIVGVHKGGDESADDAVRAGVAKVHVNSDGIPESTLIGIIDYLQTWGVGKTLAHRIKTFERNKATIKPARYADRFVEHFEYVIMAVDGDLEMQKKRRDEHDRKIGYRCFPFVRQ